MNDRVDSARVALAAELFGDIQRLVDRADALSSVMDRSANALETSVASLQRTTQAHRDQIDDTLARLRVEFATLMKTATDHAARSVVGEQTEVLERAAVAAVHQALTKEARQRTQADWLRLVAVGAGIGALVAMLMSSLAMYLARTAG